jgi:hypothetical protein
MSLPSTEEEPDHSRTTQVDNHGEVTTLDEEATNPDQYPDEEETQVGVATIIRTGSSATSARSKGIDKRSAGKGSRKTNHAEMHKDKNIGRGSTSWMRTQTRRWSTPSTTRTSDFRTETVPLTLPEFSIDQELQPFPAIFGFSVKSWMTPLIQAPSIIPQLILSLCTMSIATCNRLFENMTAFYGDKNKTKIFGSVNGKTFYWRIDTGSQVTCMNINSFETANGKKKEEKQNEYKKDIFIKKRKCSHTVQISDELCENILGIDFLQKFWLHLDPKTQQVTFLPTPSKALFSTKNLHYLPF